MDHRRSKRCAVNVRLSDLALQSERNGNEKMQHGPAIAESQATVSDPKT